MTSRNYRRNQYIASINRVIDHIESHLDKSLTLREPAEIACFSPFHFHRMFSAIVGEPLNQFVGRVRVERAALQLITNLNRSITDIALDNGFSSSATFARAFQKRYGMSASRWRAEGYAQLRKNGKTNRKDGKDSRDAFGYLDVDVAGEAIRPVLTSQRLRRYHMQPGSSLSTEVKIITLPPMHVAYVRHVGPYKGDSQLFQNLRQRLMHWAGPRSLMQQPDLKMLCVYHDAPEITDEANLRTSICITVAEGTQTDGEIGAMQIAGGTYASGYFEIDVTQYESAWGFIYGNWLPESGYQPTDNPPFEMMLNNPEVHPEKKHIFNIFIPVKPM